MTTPPPKSPLEQDANINTATLPDDLRKRARLASALARRRSDHIDALYLEAAADEIERLRQMLKADVPIIPLIAEIEPRTDPVLGHVFTWPDHE